VCDYIRVFWAELQESVALQSQVDLKAPGDGLLFGNWPAENTEGLAGLLVLRFPNLRDEFVESCVFAWVNMNV